MPIQLRQANWQQPGIDPTGEVISKVGQAVRQGAGDYQDYLDKQARAKALEDQAIADAAKAKRDMFVQDRDFELRQGAEMRQQGKADNEADADMQTRDRQMKLDAALEKANQDFAKEYGDVNLPPEEVFQIKDRIAARHGLGGTEQGQRFVGKDQSLGYANLAYKDRQLEAQKLIADARNKTSMYNEGQRAAARKAVLNDLRRNGDAGKTPEQLIAAIEALSLYDDYTPSSVTKSASESAESKEAGQRRMALIERLGMDHKIQYIPKKTQAPSLTGFSPYVPQGDASNSPVPDYLLPPQ